MGKITRRIIITLVSSIVLMASILITWQSLSSYQEEKQLDEVVGMIQPQDGWTMIHDHRVGTGILCVSYDMPCKSTLVRYDTNQQVTEEDVVRSFPGVKIDPFDIACTNERIKEGKTCSFRSTTDNFRVNIWFSKRISNESDMKYSVIYSIRPHQI